MAREKAGALHVEIRRLPALLVGSRGTDVLRAYVLIEIQLSTTLRLLMISPF